MKKQILDLYKEILTTIPKEIGTINYIHPTFLYNEKFREFDNSRHAKNDKYLQDDDLFKESLKKGNYWAIIVTNRFDDGNCNYNIMTNFDGFGNRIHHIPLYIVTHGKHRIKAIQEMVRDNQWNENILCIQLSKGMAYNWKDVGNEIKFNELKFNIPQFIIDNKYNDNEDIKRLLNNIIIKNNIITISNAKDWFYFYDYICYIGREILWDLE